MEISKIKELKNIKKLNKLYEILKETKDIDGVKKTIKHINELKKYKNLMIFEKKDGFLMESESPYGLRSDIESLITNVSYTTFEKLLNYLEYSLVDEIYYLIDKNNDFIDTKYIVNLINVYNKSIYYIKTQIVIIPFL